MSYTETRKGKVRKICDVIDIERYCSEIAYSKGLTLPEEYDTYEEFIEEDFRKEYVFLKNGLYQIIIDEEFSEHGFLEAKENQNGEIEYFLQWYNGGASFNEALYSAIKDIK